MENIHYNNKRRNHKHWNGIATNRNLDMGPQFQTNNQVRKPRNMAQTPQPINLLIEAFIEMLNKITENDVSQQKKFYKLICNKLSEMLLIDDNYNRDEFSSLTRLYQTAFTSITSGLLEFKFPNHTGCEKSRYKSDFEELSFIAAGGFGKVYKARHYLDQVIYAVKKITLKTDNVERIIDSFREVQILAQLNHPNIVQYKSTWLEPLMLQAQPALPAPEVKSMSSDDIVFEHSTSSVKSSCDKESENNLALCQYQGSDVRYNLPINKLGVVLYVTMQLCDESLRQWLDRRSSNNDPIVFSQCIAILMQAAAGLEYIHSKGVVHHDIKPSNIFFNEDLKFVQVGDFGLSCSLHGHSSGSACTIEGGKVGTKLYIAPEQVRGHCDSKSDMYSLGLVLIELFTIFNTEMERVDVLKKCRDGVLPDKLPSNIIPIAEELLAKQIDQRPTASILLSKLQKLLTPTLTITKVRVDSFSEEDSDYTSVCDAKDEEIKQKDEIIQNQDNEINRLRKLLEEKNYEILKLRSRLSC